jgi:hypothetical protein
MPRGLAATLAVLVTTLVVPALAQAGTVTQTGSTLTYTADAGEVNNVDVDVQGGEVLIRDTGVAAISIGTTACMPTGDAHEVNCGSPSVNGYSGVSLVLGDEIDVGSFEDGLPLATRTADGGGDNDVLNGSAQPDTLVGGSGGDNLNGGDGDNDLRGGDGNDTIDATGTGQDTVNAGAGPDKVYTVDGSPDSITCGSDTDRLDADSTDTIGADCEEDVDGNPLVHHGPPATTLAPLLQDGAAGTTTFRGTVTVKQPPARAHFEWGLTPAYGFGVDFPSQFGSSGQHSVSASYGTRLLPGGRTLHARLVASDGTGTSSGGDVTFREPNAPIVFALPRVLGGDLQSADSSVGATRCCDAKLDGEPTTVDLPAALVSGRGDTGAGAGAAVTGVGALGPRIPPSARLAYGTSKTYGHTTGYVTGTDVKPPTPPDLDNSSRSADLMFHIQDLDPGTVYHARMDATTYGGFNRSPDFTFATPPGRAGEAGSASFAFPSGSSGGGGTATVEVHYQCVTQDDSGCGGKVEMDYSFSFSSSRLRAASKGPIPKRVVVGRGKFHIAAGRKGDIKVTLTKAGRKLLRHRKKLRLQAVYRTKGPGGRTLKTATPFILKRKG